MGRKMVNNNDLFSNTIPMETMFHTVDDETVQPLYMIRRNQMGEYSFWVPLDENCTGWKHINSSYSGAFEKERIKWGK